ncbi:hypothetical protein M091_4547 [Parabacteroides distasonis str. 3776 D15 i]|uniref:Uncharacterized protein n=1 Tax=Parabacteroides distasonis str. 3776 D15 i TaxID=1339342 RepID=A0AB34LIC6_PARDI|nr:hypothetical protein M091_4547 [Parabacteroides distasonis str. 3776 D15 i]
MLYRIHIRKLLKSYFHNANRLYPAISLKQQDSIPKYDYFSTLIQFQVYARLVFQTVAYSYH